MLHVLLQIGFLGFQQQTQEAARRIGIQPPLVEMVPVTTYTARRLAWSPICAGCAPTVRIAVDVAAIAPRPVLRYLAYHEVCHIYLGHTLRIGDPLVEEQQADSCLSRVLGVEAFTLKWQRDVFAEGQLRPLRRRQFGPESLR